MVEEIKKNLPENIENQDYIGEDNSAEIAKSGLTSSVNKEVPSEPAVVAEPVSPSEITQTSELTSKVEETLNPLEVSGDSQDEVLENELIHDSASNVSEARDMTMKAMNLEEESNS